MALVLKPLLSSQLKPANGIAYVIAATFAALIATGLFVVPGVMPQVGVGALA